MGIPNETRSTRHLKAYALFHLAALKADPATPHLVEPTEKALGAALATLDKREAAEQTELNLQALATRKDFDLDALTRAVELGVLAAVGKDRESSGYRAAFPLGLTGLVDLRGRDQENATSRLTDVLRERFAQIAEQHGESLEQLAKAAAEADEAWRAAERASKAALTDEQIARSELVRQLHSNRGALRALYPRDARRVASYFPPNHRADEELDGEEEPDVDDGAVARDPASAVPTTAE
jgi:hypothetical protein